MNPIVTDARSAPRLAAALTRRSFLHLLSPILRQARAAVARFVSIIDTEWQFFFDLCWCTAPPRLCPG